MGKEIEPSTKNKSDLSGLSLAFWLNFLFSVLEVIGGLLTNSTAIIADAFHDFMDAGAIGLALLMEKVSKKERTTKFSYGFKRFSLLSAIGLSVFLLIGSVTMVFAAYNSFIEPKEVHSMGMFGLAVLGLAINSFAFLRIKSGGRHSHDHAHAHSHSHSGPNQNSRSIMLHLLEDVLGWAAVLVGALIIHFTSWSWVDGVLTIGIALFIGFNATKNLISTLKVMLQAVPEGIDVDKLEAALKDIKGVVDIHDVHVWSLDGSYNVGSVHAVVDPLTAKSKRDMLQTIFKVMKQQNIQHPTVQIEETAEDCEHITAD